MTATVADRIKLVRAGHGLSQEEFAERLSRGRETITRGAVGNWERGKGIKTENLTRIAETFDVSLNWLANNKGRRPEFPELHRRIPLDEFDAEHIAPRPAVFAGGRANLDRDEIPQVDARMGLGLATDAPTIEIPVGDGSVAAVPVIDTWRIPKNVLQRRLRGSAASLHILECEGDSMEPRIHNGDFVFIDTSRRIPSPPGIFALHDGFGQTVKRLEIIPNSSPPRVKIIADNPRHEAYERSLEEISIIGRYLCRLTMD